MDISVIIPTYHPRPELLGYCLRSLANQTLDKARFEVVAVQNGLDINTDTLELIAAHFPQLQLKLIKTSTAGVSNARNLGIDASTGANICFIDDDDWVSEDFLEKLLAHQGEGDIIVSFFATRTAVDGLDEPDYVGTAYRQLVNRGSVGIYEGRRFIGSACGKLIPRQIIGDNRFNTHFAMGEDALFMAQLTKGIQSIKIAPEFPTYYRRFNPESASRTKKPFTKRLNNLLRLWSAYARIYLSAPRRYELRFFINRLLASAKWLFMWKVR